jgi:hypothetical protein
MTAHTRYRRPPDSSRPAEAAIETYRREKERRRDRPPRETELQLAAAKREYDAMVAAQAASARGRKKKAPTVVPTPKSQNAHPPKSGIGSKRHV